MPKVETNLIYHDDSRQKLKELEPDSVALSFWSPPYFVGKEYEKDATYDSWQSMLQEVVEAHYRSLTPGGFLVINIANILCFQDESLPKIQALNISRQRSKVTREMVLEAKEKHPEMNKQKLATLLGCSEQTIDRRLNGNNIRGGKYNIQTRVRLVGDLEKLREKALLYIAKDSKLFPVPVDESILSAEVAKNTKRACIRLAGVQLPLAKEIGSKE
jgi:site-specific DNA-methyltransferase (adenine-specific)